MARSRELSVLHGILKIMWDHGWGEDAKCYVEYNDPHDVDSLFTNCMAETDRKKLNEICEKFRWDEEYDLNHEDEGLCSIAQEIGSLFRKHQLIQVPEGKFPAKVTKRVSTTFTAKCPVCNAGYRSESEIDREDCPRCGAEWQLEKDYE